MPSRLFAPTLALAFISTLLYSNFCVAAAANDDYKKIQAAIFTSALAEDLNSGKPSNEMRESLLQSASTADRQNIKSMLARWKKPSEVRYEAQFDQLVMFSKKNDEVFRIFPKPNSSGVFYINGREWKVPADRNMYKSLNQFFRSPNSTSGTAANLIFEILQNSISKALAATEDIRMTSQAAAFYYAAYQSQIYSFDVVSAKTRLSYDNPAEKLLRTSGGFFRKTWDAVAGNPKDVQCTPTGAKGRILVDKEPLEFQTTNDGRVIFRMFDDKRKTFQSVSEVSRFYEREAVEIRNALGRYKSHQEGQIAQIARDVCRYPVYAQVSKVTEFCQNPRVQAFNKKRLNDDEYKELASLLEKSKLADAISSQEGGPVLFRGNVQFSECQDATCSISKPGSRLGKSMSSWIGENDPAPVGIALNHVPRDQRELGYVIEFDCPKDTKCQNLVLKNPERMNAKSLAEAHLVLATAQDHYKKTEQEHQVAAMSLAPLHGCCADEACRNSDFGKSLKFVRSDEGISSSKPTSR